MLKLIKSYSSQLNHRSISSAITTLQQVTSSKRYTGPIQEDFFRNALKDGKIPSVTEWKLIKSDVLSHGRVITNVNFDAMAIGFCASHKNYEAGKTLLKFIEESGEKLNVGAIGKFMKLYYVCNENNTDLNEDEQTQIITMYNDLKKEYPIFASVTSENIIHALSLTKAWKECLKLLDDIKITARPSASTYSVIIKVCFQNKEYEIGWKLLNEMIGQGILPQPLVYKSWFENERNNMENIKKMLIFLADYDIHPSKAVTDLLLNILKPFSYTGLYTVMSNRGICRNCKQPLQKISVNNEEFERLRSVFMHNVIIGKNLFNKTTPEELLKFQKFMEHIGKFDMVIDGLNVAYSAGVKKSPHIYAKMLTSVIAHFRQNSKRILVLGRVHMNNWPKMDYIRRNADVFLAQNLSQDDPFLLYATMSSGLGTNFLSRDFMRGHSYLLMDPNLKKIFRQWQQLHQYSLIYVENSGKVHFKEPFPILSAVQEHKNGWHIPYVEEYTANPATYLEPPKQWLCITKR